MSNKLLRNAGLAGGLLAALVMVWFGMRQAEAQLPHRLYAPMVAADKTDDITPVPSPSPSPSPTASPSPSPSASPSASASPSPSPSASPSPGSSPSPSPSPTSTVPGGNCASLSADSMQTDDDGNLHVFGLVNNSCGNTIYIVQIEASFTDGGAPVDDANTISSLVAIPAGGDSPFDVVLESPAAGIDGYTLSVAGYEVAVPFLSPTNINETVTVFDNTRVAGTLVNGRASAYEDVYVWVAVLNASGDVVWVDVGDAVPSTIPRNGNSAFDIDFSSASVTGAASARAWAEAPPSFGP